MSAPDFRLETIYGLPTRRVMLGKKLVGHLYQPRGGEKHWEIWPTVSAKDLWHPVEGYAAHRFASEDDALDFLGLLAPAAQVAA